MSACTSASMSAQPDIDKIPPPVGLTLTDLRAPTGGGTNPPYAV